MSEPRRHALYRMFDAAGTLLYVGLTAHVEARMSQHKVGKEWWPDVANVQLEHFPSREEVARAEREAISSEKPLFNVMHAPRPPRPSRHGSRRATRLRTTQVDDETWVPATACARLRGETLSAVMRNGVREYVARHKHLLADSDE